MVSHFLALRSKFVQKLTVMIKYCCKMKACPVKYVILIFTDA